jgi:hypothetical protein
LQNSQKLLSCLKDPDTLVKKNAAYCICEIVNKSPENAINIVNSGGAAILVEFITNVKGEPRLYGILTLGFIAAFKEELATTIIESKAINQLRDALQSEPGHNIKAAACYALGHIGRHSDMHAKEVAEANVLSLMLYHYMNPEASEELKDNAKKALKKIIDNCSHLSALEPLLLVAPEKILKHILNQYIKHLEFNLPEKKTFVQNGGIKKIQKLRSKVSRDMLDLLDTINGFYPANIIKYYADENQGTGEKPEM